VYGDVGDAKTIGFSDLQVLRRCRQRAVDERALWDAVGKEENEVVLGMPFLSGLQYDERADEATVLLAQAVEMRVVHECPHTPRRDSYLEASARPNGTREPTCRAAPAGNAIVIALKFDAVPMDSRRLVGPVDHLDARRLPAGEHQHGPRILHRILPWLGAML